MTDQSCRRHQWEVGANTCNSCAHPYCADCLVYVHGPHKPPLCVQCALAKGGIRPGSRSPRKGWRERRHEAKVRKATVAAVRTARQEAEARAAGADFGPGDGIRGLATPDVGSWDALDGMENTA